MARLESRGRIRFPTWSGLRIDLFLPSHLLDMGSILGGDMWRFFFVCMCVCLLSERKGDGVSKFAKSSTQIGDLGRAC